MENRVLVAYSSKFGATAAIGKKIGEIIHQANLQVDVLSVIKVKDLNPSKAVVLSSALCIGHWRMETAQFLKNYQKEL
jgi:menaquinone-dependent protoporphyrinogen oxidase